MKAKRETTYGWTFLLTVALVAVALLAISAGPYAAEARKAIKSSKLLETEILSCDSIDDKTVSIRLMDSSSKDAKYIYQISKTKDFSKIKQKEESTSSYHVFGGLDPNTKYYVRAKVEVDDKESKWCERDSFKTEIDTPRG